METAVEFRTKPDRVYAKIPRTRSGVVAAGRQPFTCYPRTGSEQCPGCGGDIAEWWVIEAENHGAASPELGEAFAATCRNQIDKRECGQRMAGTVVEMDPTNGG